MTRPRRGRSATMSAPTVGTKSVSDSMESITTNAFAFLYKRLSKSQRNSQVTFLSPRLKARREVHSKFEVHQQQQPCRAEDQPACVRADVARLDAAQN